MNYEIKIEEIEEFPQVMKLFLYATDDNSVGDSSTQTGETWFIVGVYKENYVPNLIRLSYTFNKYIGDTSPTQLIEISDDNGSDEFTKVIELLNGDSFDDYPACFNFDLVDRILELKVDECTNADVGNYYFSVTINDNNSVEDFAGPKYASTNYFLNILPSNSAPIFTSTTAN